MPEQNSQRNALPEGIVSLLDTDLYKLTMQSAILKYLPEAHVTYAFTNRTPHMRLTREAYQWLQQQIKKLANIVVSPEEIQFLRKTCPYLSPSYLRFLSSFRLRPSQQVRTTFRPLNDTGGAEDVGDLHMDLEGRWLDTILYEVSLLALTSEAYFRFCDRDWNHKDQEEMAYDKGTKLMANGCIFSEFGSRRRRDYHTQDLVLRGLKKAHDEVPQRGWQGKLSGTSNVHFAMKYGILPVGTVAHEWFMGIASITNDYTHANEAALRYWVGCFGEGVLGIALTDTFGTPVFLKAFRRTMPTPEDAERDAVMTQIPGATGAPVSPPDSPDREERGPDYVTSKGRSYAQIFQGVRQDSGNPLEFVKLMKDFYHSQGITEKKTIVFSDSLNVERCLEYKKVAEEAGFAPSFGVGTFLTNDFLHLSDGTKSAPLNIVIKISSAGGRPAVKISDNVGKNTGDSETVHKVKETLGYVEKMWAQGDEKTRWGTDGSEATTVTNQEK